MGLNENDNFNYSSCSDDIKGPNISPLHMPLPISMVCTYIEENDGSVFAVPSSKKDQSPIIFGRVRHCITTSNDSDKNLGPPQFFLYARSAHRMMKERGYDLHRGKGLNFEKR